MELAFTLSPGPRSAYRQFQIGLESSSFHNAVGTSSALKALRDTLHKSTTIQYYYYKYYYYYNSVLLFAEFYAIFVKFFAFELAFVFVTASVIRHCCCHCD